MVMPHWSAKKKAYHSSLHISRRYKWTEENLRQVVVHEMIHLAIGEKNYFTRFFKRENRVTWIGSKLYADFTIEGRNRQTLWGGCTDANPKLLLNDT